MSIYGPLAGVFDPRKAQLGTLFALICFRPQTKTSVRLKVDQSSKEGASIRGNVGAKLKGRGLGKVLADQVGGGVGLRFKERVGTCARVTGVPRKIHDNTYDIGLRKLHIYISFPLATLRTSS